MYRQEWIAVPGHKERICLHRWEPEGTPRLVMQICHGMAEYLLRYADFAAHLNEQGILVYGVDHPGHGETEGTRGFFAEKNGWDYVIDANVAAAHKLHEETAALHVPYVLLGHSMGSFVARTIAAFHGDCADAYIFVGTAGKNPLLVVARAIAAAQRALCGPRHTSKLLTALNFGPYNKGNWEHRTDVDWICSDPAVVDAYVADEGCGFPFTTAAFGDMYGGLRVLESDRWTAGLDKEKPYLLLAGAEDPVGARGKGVTEVADRMRQAGARDVTLKLYDGMRHEILNETDKQTVYHDIDNWLAAHWPSERGYYGG